MKVCLFSYIAGTAYVNRASIPSVQQIKGFWNQGSEWLKMMREIANNVQVMNETQAQEQVETLSFSRFCFFFTFS